MSDDFEYEEPHEHDANGNCLPPGVRYVQPPPVRFNPWNLLGTALTTIAGCANVIGAGLNQAADLAWDHARWVREREAAAEAAYLEELEREKMHESLERVAFLDEHWAPPIVEGDDDFPRAP